MIAYYTPYRISVSTCVFCCTLVECLCVICCALWNISCTLAEHALTGVFLASGLSV